MKKELSICHLIMKIVHNASLTKYQWDSILIIFYKYEVNMNEEDIVSSFIYNYSSCVGIDHSGAFLWDKEKIS